MAISDEYLQYVVDQLRDLGPVESRKMFGGAGIYRDGVMFALISGDELYFKVDDTNREDFEKQGMEPFRPYPGKSQVMPYYQVPVEVLEISEDLAQWARRSLGVARKAKNQ